MSARTKSVQNNMSQNKFGAKQKNAHNKQKTKNLSFKLTLCIYLVN